MKIAVRVDSGTHIGSGHVMRCLALASEVRRRDAQVVFICRRQAGHFTARIEQAGFECVSLPETGIQPVSHDYATWLGVSQERDAADTIAALRGTKPDWIVADHYALGAPWQRVLRAHVGRIFVIDDLADREHDCDLLLDQNYAGEDTAARYGALVPAGCVRLLGPRYALLQREYAAVRDTLAGRVDAVRRVLVFFGGTDPSNETAKVLEALSFPLLAHLGVDVVLGVNHVDADGIRGRIAERAGTMLHRDLPTLAGLMARADLAVGAAGTTTWERLCLGLPSVVVTLAPNQVPVTQALARDGYVRWLGDAAAVTPDTYRDAIIEQSRGVHADLASLVDGLGAARVSEALSPSRAERSTVRRFRPADAALFPQWRHVSVSAAGVDIAVVEAGELPVGAFQVQVEDDRASLSYTLDPIVRGRGWEDRIVSEALGRRRGVLTRLDSVGQADAGEKSPSVVILSDARSWINRYLPRLLRVLLERGHRVCWSSDATAVPSADLCFLLNWRRIVDATFRARFQHVLVVHASDLPRGRGWSPWTWQILEGGKETVVSLIEAQDAVDSGVIYRQERVQLSGNELLPELQDFLGDSTVRLCSEAVAAVADGLLTGRPQEGNPTWYGRRKPEDSRLDPKHSIADQFDLLRVVDNRAYPAFFDMRGRRYILEIHSSPAQS